MIVHAANRDVENVLPIICYTEEQHDNNLITTHQKNWIIALRRPRRVTLGKLFFPINKLHVWDSPFSYSVVQTVDYERVDSNAFGSAIGWQENAWQIRQAHPQVPLTSSCHGMYSKAGIQLNDPNKMPLSRITRGYLETFFGNRRISLTLFLDIKN